jgi:ABC-type uncharacterized transport system substrate-binding protein
MIDSRKLIEFCCAALLLTAFDVAAQPAQKIPRIGWLGMDSATQLARVAALEQGLRDLGYVEGKNIIIERRWAERHFDLLPQLAAELVALPVDIIVTAAPPAVHAAQRATTTIPIVMLIHEPVRMGVAASLAHPGGNITGLAFQDTELQMASPMMTTNRKALIELFKANKLPATCELRMYVEDGCLMTYSADLNAIFRRQASYIDRIIKGANPADLAIEQPREFEFVINESTARSLGLAIPTPVRLQATAVI